MEYVVCGGCWLESLGSLEYGGCWLESLGSLEYGGCWLESLGSLEGKTCGSLLLEGKLVTGLYSEDASCELECKHTLT